MAIDTEGASKGISLTPAGDRKVTWLRAKCKSEQAGSPRFADPAARRHNAAAVARAAAPTAASVPLLPRAPPLRLFLELALQQFHLVGQRRILGDQPFDLANRVQHRGVVAAAEPAADLRQRA